MSSPSMTDTEPVRSGPDGRLCLRFSAVPRRETDRTVCPESLRADTSERYRMSGRRIRENMLRRGSPGRRIPPRRADDHGAGTGDLPPPRRPDRGPQPPAPKRRCRLNAGRRKKPPILHFGGLVSVGREFRLLIEYAFGPCAVTIPGY